MFYVQTQMKLSSLQLKKLEQQIKQISTDFLMPLYQKVKRATKKDGSFVSEADYAIQKHIQEVLLQDYPNIPLLGEEMPKETQLDVLDNKDVFWCLDPLDGTTNFLAGIPCFAISLALIVKGEAVAGIVYDPNRDESFSAIKGEGAWLNAKPLKIDFKENFITNAVALVDFKKMDSELAKRLVISPPYASQRSFGSVALDWCWLATNRCQLYYHSRHSIWDFAAGLLIFTEAGGLHSRVDGQELYLLTLDKQTVYAAVNIPLLEKWQRFIFDGQTCR